MDIIFLIGVIMGYLGLFGVILNPDEYSLGRFIFIYVCAVGIAIMLAMYCIKDVLS